MEQLISIITPTYNSTKYISETINSIINQTYSNWELLITDDCSTDDTWSIIQAYSNKDKRIEVFKLKKNSGSGIARNNSIEKASGRYIAFCDSDDIWKSNKLEKQIAFMKKNNCGLTFSSYDIIDEAGKPKGKVVAKPMVTFEIMKRNNYIGCLTAIYDSKKIGKVYMPEIRKRQDWALWLSILKKTDKALSIIEPLAIYRVRNNSLSNNKIEMLKHNYNIYNQYLNLNKIISFFYMIRFLFYFFRYKVLKY